MNNFLEVIRLLKKYNITFWVDSGSLLGLVRDNSLIDWDSDIDLGILEDETEKLLKNKRNFLFEGYSFKVRKYNGVIYGATIKKHDRQSVPCHIHVFFKSNGIAWSPQTVIYKPEDSTEPHWVENDPKIMRNFFNWCKKEAKAAINNDSPLLRKVFAYLFCYPVWGTLFVTKKKFDRKMWEKLWPFSLYHRIYTWIIPVHYFTELDSIQVESASIPIPSKVEEYLELRYHNWRVPDRHWLYWKDDGCLVPKNPEEALADYH